MFNQNTAADPNADKGSNAADNNQSVENKKSELDTKLTALEAKISQAEAETQKLRTENLKLQQDLSENTRFSGEILRKLEGYKSEPQDFDFSNEELASRLQENPKEVIGRIVKSVIAQEAPKYVEQGSADTRQLLSDLHGAKLELSKMHLKEKFEGLDDAEWERLVKFGDEYPEYTVRGTNPKNLEALYVVFKHMQKEPLKLRNAKSDMEALLKEKFAAALDSNATPGGQRATLTDEQRRVATMYKLSDEEYKILSNPEIDYFTYKKMKEKANG